MMNMIRQAEHASDSFQAGLSVIGLEVEFPADAGLVRAVRGIDLTLGQGARLGLVGESGSGKTTTALALMRMIKAPGRIVGGTARLNGTDLLALSDAEMRRARLSRIAYIPQGAMNSLNPVYRIEEQFFDAIIDHEGPHSKADLRARVAEALEGVNLPARVARLYPHELSGGMKQRVCIAIGTILGPELILADEPTSALDVVTQRQVIATLNRQQERLGAAMILIGHDIGLMAQSVHELMVMRNGDLVEHGEIGTVLRAPKATYTRALVDSVPRLTDRRSMQAPDAAPQTATTPVLELKNVSKVYGKGLFAAGTTALHPLTLTMPGDRPVIVSVVGQSGSGKTTLGDLCLGLSRASGGAVLFDGHDISRLDRSRSREFRRDMQAVFQDPYASFNPFYRVEHGFSVPLKEFGIASSRDEMRQMAMAACEGVGLDAAAILDRFPHELSGGQRQRLMVARAMMLRPRMIIADEPVSMVDASQRAEILADVNKLKDDHGISVLYITHDLATAYQVSDYVIVLQNGRVVEAGSAEQVIGAPEHPYTRLLIRSIPWPDPDPKWGAPGQLDKDRAELNDQHPAMLRGDFAGVVLRVQQ